MTIKGCSTNSYLFTSIPIVSEVISSNTPHEIEAKISIRQKSRNLIEMFYNIISFIKELVRTKHFFHLTYFLLCVVTEGRCVSAAPPKCRITATSKRCSQSHPTRSGSLATTSGRPDGLMKDTDCVAIYRRWYRNGQILRRLTRRVCEAGLRNGMI